jgi:hypothetical protein
LDPWEAAQLIMDRWDKKKLECAPKLARLVICTIAVKVPYQADEQRERAVAWACREAPQWWRFLPFAGVTLSHLRQIMHQYDETGRI